MLTVVTMAVLEHTTAIVHRGLTNVILREFSGYFGSEGHCTEHLTLIKHRVILGLTAA